MSQPIKKVISQVYELEGLLLLIQNHGENTDQFIYEMAHEKSNSIAELVSTLSPNIFSKQAEITKGIDEAKQDETNENEIKDIEIASINLSEFEGIMLGADNSYDLDDNLTEEITEEIIVTAEIEVKQEVIEDDEIEVEIIYNESPSEPEIAIQEEVTVEDIERAEEIEEIETVEDIEAVKDIEIIEEEIIENPVIIPTLSKDFKSVRKAFSLNDRFRYKRELFANSDVEMNNTLDLVDTMKTYAEAEEYFYNDLQWDKESLEVIDFMFIIRNHF